MARINKELLILTFICLVAFLVRLHQFSTPLADWHSFRQADTASVAREFIKHGINPLVPKYHDLSNIQSGFDNLEGYRMVEFPFISAGVAFVYPLYASVLELHQFYRLTSIMFSIGTIILLYLLASRLDTKPVGLFTAGVYAFLPFSIYYSRTVLPEIPQVFFIVAMMVAFIKYIDTRRGLLLLLYGLCLALALLLKPTALFFLLPLVVYALLQQQLSFAKVIPWVITTIISFIPLVFWRYWIQQYHSGIPVSLWLLNGNGIRFRPAFFRWIFAERISGLILGYWGVVLMSVGFLYPYKTLTQTSPFAYIHARVTRFFRALRHSNTLHPQHLSTWFYVSWTFAMLAYLVIIATGNVQHDYYQIILLPLIVILVARGIMYLVQVNTLISYALVVVCVFFMLGFSWFQVAGYFNINNWAISIAGQAVDRLTPADALVIAPYMGDTAFLYQTNRRGWPIGFDIDDKIKKGASYYVSTSYDDEARELEKRFTLIEKTDEYILIQLQ